MNDIDELKQMENELKMCKLVNNHSNVIKIIDHDTSTYQKTIGTKKEVSFIVQELASGGELFDIILISGKFNENVARYYFKQMMDGIEYCHNNGVTHRDLKPENLLFDNKYTLKIADFGLSTFMKGSDGKGNLTTNCGTYNYMAPEILLKLPYKGE